jgi:hypothetical protein
VSLTVPDRAPLRTLNLRLRLPDGKSISGVQLDGRILSRFDPETGTIRIPPQAGAHELQVDLAP